MYAPLQNVNTRNISLEELNDLEVKTLIPAIIYTSLLMICGVIGNALVLYIYCFRYKPSNHRYFILTLGVCDFITCAICMPFLIVDEFHPFMFTSVITCKSFRYVTYNTALISIFTLFVIAIERYRKICKPLECQLTLPLARRILFGIVFLTSTIFALPSFIMYGHASISTGRENISGVACFTDDKFRNSYFPVAYNTTLFAIVFLLGTVMVYCYIKIAHQRLLRTKLNNARRKYKLIESSGNFISEQSENYLHTSAINDLAQEYREHYSDQTTQTNDSVLQTSKALNRQFSISNLDESKVNKAIKMSTRQTVDIETRLNICYKLNRDVNGLRKVFKFDESGNLIKTDMTHFSIETTKKRLPFKNRYELFETIDNTLTITKNSRETNAKRISKARSQLSVIFPECNLQELNEADCITNTKRMSFTRLLSSNREEDGCNKSINLISELYVSNKCLNKIRQKRRHSFPDTAIHHVIYYSLDENEYSLSHDNLVLNINGFDQKTHLCVTGDFNKINKTSNCTDIIKEEEMSTLIHEYDVLIDDGPRCEITDKSCKTYVPMERTICQHDNSSLRIRNNGKTNKSGNKANPRNRKCFIRRNKTKSAKFAKLRENSLFTVTKMLFYITLVYFISFIPHLVLMITLMLDNQFLTSLDNVETPIFYIALRSFLINSVANPFIYNFMDTKFRKECQKIFNRKRIIKL